MVRSALIMLNLCEVPARIRQKFDVDKSGCWIWNASLCRKGYGNVYWNGRILGAHRVVYTLLAGPIPDGLQLDHLCRNPACVNPGHLEPVTSRENTMRGETRAAENARKTHCLRGHACDDANTIVHNGKRACAECRRVYLREYKKRPTVAENLRSQAREAYRRRMSDPVAHEAIKQRMRDYYQRRKAAGQ